MKKLIKNRWVIFIFLTLITLIIYVLSYRGEGKNYNYFVLLADGFLHGHFYVDTHPSWLNELVFWKGHYFVVYPPMPAILLMPLVALFGTDFNQPYLSIGLGAINVGLCFLVLEKLFGKRASFLTAIAFGLGSFYWYTAEVGSAWYIAHVVAIFFLWLSLLELFGKSRLFLVGFLIGVAYLARLPTILALVFVLIYQRERFIEIENKKLKIHFKSWILFGLGLAPAVLFDFAYNYFRFGVISDIAYTLLPIYNEPWYRYGLFSIRYIPIHLKEMFTALPTLTKTFPYAVPSLYVMAIWLVAPILLIIPWAKFRDRVVWSALITTLVISLPSLLHGENGFSQFGYRFALDYFPFLLIAVASGIKNAKWWIAMILIVAGILINFWGVYFISILNIWTM